MGGGGGKAVGGAWEDVDLLTEGTIKGDRFSIPVPTSNRLLGATVGRGGFRYLSLVSL